MVRKAKTPPKTPARRKQPPTGRPEGRPTKLTAPTAKIVLDSIRDGDFVEVAAELAHVHKDTVNGWNLVGRRREWEAQKRHPTPYESACMKFSDLYAHAEAEAEHEDVQAIRDSGLKPAIERTTTEVTELVDDGKGGTKEMVTKRTVVEREIPPDPRAIQWHASKRWTQRWANREKLEMSGPAGGPVPVEVSIDKIIESLAKLRGAEAEATDGQTALPKGQTNGH